MPKFILKAGKEACEIQLGENQSYEQFQAKVFALTDIPPKNLKVLHKGKMIKDNAALLAIPDGTELKVMGTKSGNELKQTDLIKSDNIMIEQPQKIRRHGLVNIGNTCYMNASIQFIKSVPAVDKMIKSIKNIPGQNSMIPLLLADTLKRIEMQDVQPLQFVQIFLTLHPQFQPFKSQHDADQFLQKLLDDVKGTGQNNAKVLRDMFEIEFVETIKNSQLEQEQQKFSITTNTKIGCSLGGNDKDLKVGTMSQGIKLGLQTKIQKKSPIDNLNHIYTSKTKINSLPPFLIVQMVRFFWKQVNDPDSQFNKPVATKICRSVDFSGKLDVFDFCTDQLKQKLIKGRQALEQGKKREEVEFKAEFEEYKKLNMDQNRPQARILAEFKEKKQASYKPLTEGLETGQYEIHAVVTHLGNSVESGHYMAWVKQTQDEWTKYDDDNVYEQPESKVFQLRGGQPNLEIAYLFMFRKVYAKEL